MSLGSGLLKAVLSIAILMSGGGIAHAQDYPSRIITLVVPYPPGGPTDTIARLLAERAGRELKQKIIVENKPGAGGNIGTNSVARSAPDGYTLCLSTNGPLAGNLSLVANMPYDPLKDLAPVTLVTQVPSVLAVNPSVNALDVPQLVDLLKSHPSQYNFASAGLGTSSHFAGELFKSTAMVQMVHIPFNGDGPSLQAVVAGHVQIFFGSVATALPNIEAGKLRVLAVTSAARVPVLPNVPTLSEAGLTGFDLGGWYAIVAPAGVNPAVIEKLNKAFVVAVHDTEVSDRIKLMGGIPVAGPPGEVTDLIHRDIARWANIARGAGIKRE
ncbi:MAG: tripartite tricarboxylate transporter substrate binding protein [Rhizobiales bacterium]|nr:tripartite tricarboxylate transporter substrate binding protein [Hyphomicrobiales bacterium]